MQKQRLRRAQEKAEAEKAKEEEIERQIKSGNLNYGTEYKGTPFMTWERFKEIWGDTATFDKYLEEKMEHDTKEQAQMLDPQFSKKFFQIPIKGEACRKFRFMCMGSIPKDSLFCGLHHENCRLYGEWYDVFKNEFLDVWQGCHAWQE